MTADTELHTQINVSKLDLSAILLQRSRRYAISLVGNEKYPTYELDVLGRGSALEKLHQLLLGLSFIISNDYEPFQDPIERKDPTSRIAGWALLLEEFNYRLEYHPGC